LVAITEKPSQPRVEFILKTDEGKIENINDTWLRSPLRKKERRSKGPFKKEESRIVGRRKGGKIKRDRGYVSEDKEGEGGGGKKVFNSKKMSASVIRS